MIQAPTNPSPYNSVVEPVFEGDGAVKLKASCQNTNEVDGTKAMLVIDDISNKHYFTLDSSSWTANGGEISVDTSKFNADRESYYINNRTFTRNTGYQRIGEIIKSPRNYTWQVRLYDVRTSNFSVNIGYGFIDDFLLIKASDKDKNAVSNNSKYVLRIRPHTNMFGNAGLWKHGNKEISQSLQSYYDDNVKYEIEIKGIRYPVLAYHYGKSQLSSDFSHIQLDSYGNPLFAYVEIAEDIRGEKASAANFAEGDEYTIYTNYKDSGEYYFMCRENGSIDFAVKSKTNTDTYTDIEGAADKIDNIGSVTEDNNTIALPYSDFVLTGEYSQNNGAAIQYYKVMLYFVKPDGDEYIIHDTGNIYDSSIKYEFSDFMLGGTYKLVLSAKDSNGKLFVKSCYIKPTFDGVTKPTLATVTPYREHGSVIIDFSKLISISGELVGDTLDSEGLGYKIGKIVYSEIDIPSSDGGIAETVRDYKVLMDETYDASLQSYTDVGYACYIYPQNKVVYSKYDNSSIPLIFPTAPLVNMVFRNEIGTPCEIFECCSSDYIVQSLKWTGEEFVYTVGVPMEAKAYDSSGNPTWLRTISGKTARFSPYSSARVADEAWRTNGDNYSYLYTADDDMTTDDTYYTHDEDAARDFLWRVIATGTSLYIQCIDAPDDKRDDWVFYDSWNKLSFNRYANIPKTSRYIYPSYGLTLFGGVVYYNVSVEGIKSNSSFSYDDMVQTLINTDALAPLTWNNNSFLTANFTNNLAGGNYDGTFPELSKFKVYKTLGNQPKLYKVCECAADSTRIVEDFAVGSMCDITYYIVPVCKEDGHEVNAAVIQTDTLTLTDGTVKVIGLIQSDDDFNTYYVDIDNVYGFDLNITNNGFTNNFPSTFQETQHRYPMYIDGDPNYRSMTVEGLLGRIDCGNNGNYVDTYDDIIEWERFVHNGQLKLLIDQRGIQTVGQIESNSFTYDEHGARTASVNFGFKQTEDIDNITILNRELLFNPSDGLSVLADSNGVALKSGDDRFLLAKEG